MIAHTDSRAYYYKVLAVTFVLVIAFSFVLWYADDRAVTEKDRLCAVVYKLEERAGATLGLRGTPGFVYYRDHPLRLARAKAQARANLSELPCGPP